MEKDVTSLKHNIITIIGGGLAGSEAAYRIASCGVKVRLLEMRPGKSTPAHQTGNLAELVCSNSLKSEIAETAQGLLKQEMKALGSLLLNCAEKSRVPAGAALAVDREAFSQLVTEVVTSHPLIELVREEVTGLPESGITIVATGPLTSEPLTRQLQSLSGEENLYFYDAIAPSVTEDSLNKEKIFRASRYGKGEDDYYNCPLSREEYVRFHQELVEADVREGHSIDRAQFFDSCMPVEVLARRGVDTLRYGPMRPVGLEWKGQRPYAVVQLRQEDKHGQVWGLVGFQTRLQWGEQQRVLRMIPGLEEAQFVRFGSMHRNTYLHSPRLLQPTLQLRNDPRIFVAGQITGVEGYMESAATGILAGINAVRLLRGEEPLVLSQETMLGALVHFITTAPGKEFQPINASFGLLPALADAPKNRQERYRAYVRRSQGHMDKYSELFL